MAEFVTPPGWPREVRPPGAPGWEHTALNWLLDLCPPDYRAHDVLRRHPIVLARFAAWHVAGAQEAVRRGVGATRAELRDVVDQHTIDDAVAVLEREAARLAEAARGVALVDQALRGDRFRARL